MGAINNLVLFITHILILFVICQSQQTKRPKNFLSRAVDTARGYQRLSKFSNTSISLITRPLLAEALIPSYSKRAEQASEDNSNNTRCSKQISQLATGLVEFEPWALKMVDSSSKIPSGILIGNLKDIGFYDECVSVKIERNNDTIQGRHCMYSISIEKDEMIASFSICLPSTCYIEDLRDMLQIAINEMSKVTNVSIEVQSVTCSAVDPQPLDIGTILTIVFLLVFVGFIICCTMYDFYLRVINEKSDCALVKFSMYTNALIVLDTKIPKGNIPAIQGIRFFSMCWVILGHTYFLQMMGVVSNGTDVISWMKAWSSVYIHIATFTVDTFFTIGGFFTSYLFMKEMAKGTKFNVFMYYLHRYLRLTPALAVLLLLTIFIFPKLGSGALWEINMKEQEEMCKSNWWPILLYIQNYVNTDNIVCLLHTWYLAVDMQLFWISPIILYPLAKKPKIGLGISVVILIVSIVMPAIISASNKYSGALITSPDIDASKDMMMNFYIVTYARMGPWILGILLGYFLSQNRHPPTIRFIRIGWILTVLAFAFIFLSYRIFQIKGYTYNIYWELFYTGVSRHIWALAICWLLYAMITGYGGILNKFLSLPIFMPFGRISYCVYLFHFIFQIMNISSIRMPLYFSNWRIFGLFVGDFVICIFGGIVFSLLFEWPFIVLEKLLFDKRKASKKSSATEKAEIIIEKGEHCVQKGVSNVAFEEGEADEKKITKL